MQGMGVIQTATGIIKNRRILGDERRISNSRENAALPLPPRTARYILFIVRLDESTETEVLLDDNVCRARISTSQKGCIYSTYH
jgi:hypothetical protein